MRPIPDSESLSREYVQRLIDNYDAAAEARAERERWHTLYRLSVLIARVEKEQGVSLETERLRDYRQERDYYQNLDTGSKYLSDI